jgi:hypothetical protein
MPARNQFKSMEENVESTLGGSLQTFMSHIMGPEKFGVSTSQLFHFQMTYPRCLAGSAGSGGEHSGLFKDKYIDHMRIFSLYASEVNTPTKQITTAGYRAIGSEINYATGSTFSEMSVRFLIPRSYVSVLAFERWMTIMANDANQYVDYYSEYVAPIFYIYKLERGSKRILRPESDSEYEKAGGSSRNWPRYNKAVAGWHIYNVFPKSVGTLQFSNAPGELVTLDVTFAYERYRFFSDPKFGGEQGSNKRNKNGGGGGRKKKKTNNKKNGPKSKRSRRNRRERRRNRRGRRNRD